MPIPAFYIQTRQSSAARKICRILSSLSHSENKKLLTMRGPLPRRMSPFWWATKLVYSSVTPLSLSLSLSLSLTLIHELHKRSFTEQNSWLPCRVLIYPTLLRSRAAERVHQRLDGNYKLQVSKWN
jgi:hypothetical protein